MPTTMIRQANSVSRPVLGKRRGQQVPAILFTTCINLILFWGWSQRDEYLHTAEYGSGYSFGIIGLTLMALLLLYPLRKHWKLMSRMMPIRYWFRMHMMFGVLAPVFILFHANFSHGSINSTVALYCMLLVAGSGLVGRYVYAQLHRGLHGEQIRYKDLVRDYQMNHVNLREADLEFMETIKQKLEKRTTSVFQLFACQIALERNLFITSQPSHKRPLRALQNMARLRFYTKLFSAWHLLHMPIFFMMLLSATVHVIVVHMY